MDKHDKFKEKLEKSLKVKILKKKYWSILDIKKVYINL